MVSTLNLKDAHSLAKHALSAKAGTKEAEIVKEWMEKNRIDPSHIAQFSEAQALSFGSYCLSELRATRSDSRSATQSDLEWWKSGWSDDAVFVSKNQIIAAMSHYSESKKVEFDESEAYGCLNYAGIYAD